MGWMLDWLEIGLDVASGLLLLVLWRSYGRREPVAPHMYLFTMLCAALFLGLYVVSMPAGQVAGDIRLAGPFALLGLLWGLASSRGMILFRIRGHYYLKGSAWVPFWAVLNFVGGKFLEVYGPGLWGVGGMLIMLVASMATLGANLMLLVALARVKRFYGGAPRAGGRFHFCHACGAGYEKQARRCPACGTRRQRIA